MDHGADQAGAMAEHESGRKMVGKVGMIAGMLGNDVIFTAVAKRGPDTPATPTRVGHEEVKKAGKCCIFYNIWHNLLDFTTKLIYNKA